MTHNVNDEIYVNYMDGVIEAEIVEIINSRYRIKVKGYYFLMNENEVNNKPEIIKRVVPIYSASVGAEEI